MHHKDKQLRKMSTNLIFKVPGRTTNYMPVNINASKNEILEKYARYVNIPSEIKKIVLQKTKIR